MPLKLVPPAPPSPAEEVRKRVRRHARPDGMLQCNRCGGRTVMTTWSGSVVKNGRYKAGTVVEDKVCYICHRQGIFSPMLPDLKPIE